MKMISKISCFLKRYDALWSAPIALFAFIWIGYLLQYFGGYGTGSYDIAFFQPFFLAVCVVISTIAAVNAGLWFTFRDLFRQIYSTDGRDAFKGLPPVQRILISLSVFFILFFAILWLYKTFI